MTSPLDWMGNANLIHAAQAAGVEHFVLMSVRGAAPDHPIELFRMKYRAEQELLASKLAWTIIRPTAYLETWIMVVSKPLLKKGGTMVFGRGDNPINFVSVRDVAQFIELAVTDPALRGQPIEVGGPQNLTFKQFLEIFQTQTGASGAVRHVSRTASRLGSRVLRPINSMRAQQMGAAYFMDTADRTFDPSETMRRYPTFVPTPLTEVLARGTGGSNPPWKHLMPRRKSRSPRTCRCVWP